MANVYIAAAYWRSIKRGDRTYEVVPDEMKSAVIVLAKSDVAQDIITANDYKNIIGTDYEA